MASAQGYADRLSPYDHKGLLNLRADPDPPVFVLAKAVRIAQLIRDSGTSCVAHTGAGISVSAGIPDFRGTDGIWTMEQRALQSSTSKRRVVSFEDALPTVTHAALHALHLYVVSQNVDGLHLRSGHDRERLSELHGNLFMERCSSPQCAIETPRDSESTTVGLKETGNICPVCQAPMTDTALDWHDALPQPDYDRARDMAASASAHIVLGTSCQMDPARSLPFLNSRTPKAARVLVNLSRTPMDDRFGLVLRAPTDSVLATVACALGVLSHMPRAGRVATLAFRHADRDRVEGRVHWDSEWRARAVAGVTGVKYNDTPLVNEAGYVATLPFGYDTGTERKIEAHVVLDDGSTHSTKVAAPYTPWEQCPTVHVVTADVDQAARARNLVNDLEHEALEQINDIDRLRQLSSMFCSSEKRGRVMCIMCLCNVATAKAAKEKHLDQCIPRFVALCKKAPRGQVVRTLLDAAS